MSTSTTRSYQQAVRAAAARCVGAVLAARSLSLSVSELISLSALTVASFNQAATQLADLALATLLGTLPLGLRRPGSDVARLEEAFSTVLSDKLATEDEQLTRMELVSNAEPLDAAREAYRDAMMQHQDRVAGWRRIASPNACELCRSLATDDILPPDQPPAAHPRCSCVQEPILTTTEEAINA